MHNAPAEDAECLVPPPRPLSGVRDDFDFHPPPLAPSSTVTSVLEAAAPGAPTEDSYTITLRILNGSKVLRSLVFIRACTRTAILNEARAYCVKYVQDNQCLGILLAKEYDLALISLSMYGYDMDLSTYKVENLSSLVRAVEKISIPRFTLRISELWKALRSSCSHVFVLRIGLHLWYVKVFALMMHTIIVKKNSKWPAHPVLAKFAKTLYLQHLQNSLWRMTTLVLLEVSQVDTNYM